MSEQKLLMDDTELSISFRTAKDKRAQITVLAELNACSPHEIAQRLDAMGLLDDAGLRADQFPCQADADRPKRKYPANRRPPATEPLDEIRAMEMFREGADDLAIAEALDCSSSRIKQWRHRMHLFRPRGGSRNTTKGEPMEVKTKEAETAPVEETALLSAAEFLATLTELLTPAAVKAGLIINGSPVTAIAALHIRVSDMQPVVEIVTERNVQGGISWND